MYKETAQRSNSYFQSEVSCSMTHNIDEPCAASIRWCAVNVPVLRPPLPTSVARVCGCVGRVMPHCRNCPPPPPHPLQR